MSKITELASKLFNPKVDYRPKILPTEKRVRGILDGRVIFDTTGAKLVWENKWAPQYWIPRSAFTSEASFTDDKPISGIQSSTSKLTAGEKSITTLLVPDSFNTELAGFVKIEFNDLDQWLEEMSEVLYHPKDPFHRVDVLPTGRRVKVTLSGTVLADTGSEGGVMSLWETNFPGRWYLPRTAINWQYLKASETHTGCPYKGTASYYDAVVDGKEYKDVVWWYPNPTSESSLIAGMLCFYPDKVSTEVSDIGAMKIGKPATTSATTEKPAPPVHEHEHGHGNGYTNGSTCNC